MRFPACTVANGVFAQYGQITQVDAIYNCPRRRVRRDQVLGTPVRARSIVGTYAGKDSSCSFRGNIGGMRVLK